MPRYRMTLEFQGTRYHGWQAQANARSIQGEILKACREVLGDSVVELQGAGRTDTGVHALGQSAHLELRVKADSRKLAGDLNMILPADIAVLDVRPAPDRFHARHSAVARSYLYQVARRKSAFGKSLTWWVRDGLDAAVMSRAALGVTGMHDFSTFCDRRLEKETSTSVLVEEASVVDAGDLILLRLRASHFLWRMVRRLVGSLVEVGRGKLPPDEFLSWLERFSPRPAELTAPAAGLFLEEVLYPGETWRRPLEPVLSVAARPTSG